MNIRLFLLFLLIAPIGAIADQPSATDTTSAHLYFLENMVLVICAFFALWMGISHGFSVGRGNSNKGEAL
ncbi:uncharacterized protein NMK_2810 [Novimethylophilus kurashikiensis]|uniref:Uncharacterized protein n=1 Tax=Novimethylophilus kurashikiensis TaxID=1825523 RepID=A0A2R5FAI0_9PROT|nr:hypothetical protein [Novimethylophilus kurashikiensis]GBG15207.1 uncharacterized protein NMK_2810 [Novimethylophilus kurashikiensis]